MASNFTDLYTLLIRREQIYQELLEVSASELAFFQRDPDAGEADDLLRSQARRQELMEEAEAIEDWIAGLPESDAFTQLETEQAYEVIHRTLTLAETIAQNDRETESQLGGVMKELRGKMSSLRTGRKARDAYGQGLTPDFSQDPFLFDRKR